MLAGKWFVVVAWLVFCKDHRLMILVLRTFDMIEIDLKWDSLNHLINFVGEIVIVGNCQ